MNWLINRLAKMRRWVGTVGRWVSCNGGQRCLPDEGRGLLAVSFYLLKQDLLKATVGESTLKAAPAAVAAR